MSGGEPPTVEQRLDALEAGLGAVRGEVTDAERRAVHKARDYASQVAAEVLDDARREVGAVRDLLLRVTEPNWQVWTSLGLLVLGVALHSLASALGVSRQNEARPACRGPIRGRTGPRTSG